ncbi:Hypothetical protein HP17_04194 [Helicobacter pylori NCTC 11637 = CCUG 17874 = ATCC 43504 = JCM 12093]|nr:Hypothetical protein HP17_04194 [Helicobacter pylori NCTC 11637 = CCUG 17874 = ATCC 43504 = JCM 12093]
MSKISQIKKKKKDFHGINKILRIFMIKFHALLSFFLFLLLNRRSLMV